ncbi:CG34109 [Drosophila busckii]|uniref:CG34109 n=1 Tax=Drosophila busckii TaxID=30019 RepID=A0A0M5J1L6_DROBS|nr:CG34109 [Drosophila busckii]
MPGVVFLIVVPTANFERELIYGTSNNVLVETVGGHGHGQQEALPHALGNNNLNINLPENNNAILRLEVELRDKNVPKYRRGGGVVGAMGRGAGRGTAAAAAATAKRMAPRPNAGPAATTATTTTAGGQPMDRRNLVVPLEKVLEELLVKLEIEHVTWTTSKKGYFHHVVFPLQAGDACETTLHCLTELGIGTKLNSSVSVLPCSVSYDAITDASNMRDDYSDDSEEVSRWNNFVESIKSKLTVKQVVDGVRAGGSLSFDYLLLIVTADSLAALGLVENNAPNIVAAMLVSPLMGPVMSITFGAIISDRELMGLFWSQACIWLIYPEKRIPHLKNEAMNSTSAYPFLYTDYLPTEFLINGIVSACLTVVNVICIFITAIIVLKIKEVSAPYTASPDLKRFWETDLRTVRKTNRSTMRRGAGGKYMSGSGTGGGSFAGLDEARDAKMDTALERALAQAESDVTFRKVKRMSYSNNAVGELTERLAKIAGLNKRHLDDPLRSNSSSLAGSRINSIPNAPLDLKALDKLVSSLLEQHAAGSKAGDSSLESGTRTPPVRKASKKLNRWRPLSRSAHSFKRGGGGGAGDARDFTQLQERSEMQSALSPHPPNMPTIMESSAGSPTPNNAHASNNNPWTASLERTPAAVRNMLHNIAAGANNAEDQLNLTQNYVG